METEEIFALYVNDIYRYLFSLSKDHYLTEDLLQETFYRAHLHINELSPTNIKPWLFKVSHNLFIDYLRKNKRLDFVTNEQINSKRAHTNIEREVITKVNLKKVMNHIDLLSASQKYAITLCDVNDLSYQECAEIMGVSLASFKSTLYRARQNLRKELSEVNKVEKEN